MTENKIIRYNEHFVADEDGEVDSSSNDITPGMLVVKYGNSDYSVNTTTVEENPEVRVARKHGAIGDETTDTYSSGDHLMVAHCQRGVGVELILASGTDLGTASEANISEGDKLVTAGGANDGAVKKYDSANDAAAAVFAIATEAVDNSGAASGTTARLEAEVL